MSRSGIRGILILTALCFTIANAVIPILQPEEELQLIWPSTMYKLMKNNATIDEKKYISVQMITIITFLTGKIQSSSLVLSAIRGENRYSFTPELLGGPNGEQAFQNLKAAYESSSNKAGFLNFVDWSVMVIIRHNLSRAQQIQVFTLLIQDDQKWEGWSPEVLKDLGFIKKWKFPADQIKALAQHWTETPLLNDGALIDMLANSENIGSNATGSLAQVLSNFKTSKSIQPSDLITLTEAGSYDSVLKGILDSRIFTFDFESIRNISNMINGHEDAFLNQIKGTGALEDFFRRYNSTQVDTVLSLITAAKNCTAGQIEAFVIFLKAWGYSHDAVRKMFEKVMTTNVSREDCVGMWDSQEVSEDWEGMVKVIKLLKTEFGIESCLANFIGIRNVAELQQYWDQHEILRDGNFTDIWPINRDHERTTKRIIANLENPNKDSFQLVYRNAKSSDRVAPNYLDLFKMIRKLGEFDLGPLSMAAIQFQRFSDYQKDFFMEMNFKGSNSSLATFLKKMANLKGVNFNKFEEEMVTPFKLWTEKQFNALVEIITIAQELRLDSDRDGIIDHMFLESRDDAKCDDIRATRNQSPEDKKMIRLVDLLDDNFGKFSCGTKGPVLLPQISILQR